MNWMNIKIWLLAMTILSPGAALLSAGWAADNSCAERSYPHDPTANTQGLVFHGGQLFESTGRYGGHTSVRQVNLKTGEILLKISLPVDVFGEGLALHKGVLYQLTWHNKIVFKYDPDTLEPLGRIEIKGEAWGLASDGQRLVMSDGSAVLRFVDPVDFSETGRIQVRDKTGEVKRLNELEFVEGLLYANIHLSNRAVIINPETGKVVGELDLNRLASTSSTGSRKCIPNGIAYVPESRCLLVTGKYCNQILLMELPSP